MLTALVLVWGFSLVIAVMIGLKYDDLPAAVGVTVLFGPVGLVLAYMGARSKAARVRQNPPA